MNSNFTKSINKTELIQFVAADTGKTQVEVKEVIDKFVELIADALSKDTKVVVTNFGTFEVRHRVERRGKNPRTGESIIVPAQKTPAFKAGKMLKDAVKNR